MISTIKGFFRRRALRAFTDSVLARWEFDGIFASRGALDCHLCGERVVELQRRYEKRSLTGETFAFNEHVAYACRRCQTVSPAPDCTQSPVHVAEWVPPHRG